MFKNNSATLLAERLAPMGSRGMNFCTPESHETVTVNEGMQIAVNATKILQSDYGMPGANIHYEEGPQGKYIYVFSGNLATDSRSMRAPHSNTQRILGGHR
jgi:hypothetical protein